MELHQLTEMEILDEVDEIVVDSAVKGRGAHGSVRFGFVAKSPTEPNSSVLLSGHLQLNRWFFGSINCWVGSVGLVNSKHK